MLHCCDRAAKGICKPKIGKLDCRIDPICALIRGCQEKIRRLDVSVHNGIPVLWQGRCVGSMAAVAKRIRDAVQNVLDERFRKNKVFQFVPQF